MTRMQKTRGLREEQNLQPDREGKGQGHRCPEGQGELSYTDGLNLTQETSMLGILIILSSVFTQLFNPASVLKDAFLQAKRLLCCHIFTK